MGVLFGTARRGLGGVAARLAVPNVICYAVPNVTAHASTASVPIIGIRTVPPGHILPDMSPGHSPARTIPPSFYMM